MNIGTRVYWYRNRKIKGTIIGHTRLDGYTVQWDDGDVGFELRSWHVVRQAN